MTKKLHSLLEMAIVIGGLAVTPIVVVAAFGLIDGAQTERVAASTTVQDSPHQGFQRIDVKF